jgi:hypothetical protein
MNRADEGSANIREVDEVANVSGCPRTSKLRSVCSRRPSWIRATIAAKRLDSDSRRRRWENSILKMPEKIPVRPFREKNNDCVAAGCGVNPFFLASLAASTEI